MAKKRVKKQARKASNMKVIEKASITKSYAAFPSSNNAIFVGIDLGTSQASVLASNGIREVVPTYVGYPRDNISEELLGDKPLFGDMALKHRLSVELIRPLAPGVIQNNTRASNNKYLTAAKQLVRHLLGKARPKPSQPVYGVIGAPAWASIASKRVLIDATRGVLDAVMIVSEPFAVAYGLGILDQALVIDIGAGTIDLCRLHGTIPEEQDQITLDQAGDFVDEKISGMIHKKFPEAQGTAWLCLGECRFG